jgi:hypothetical protein
MNPTQTRGKKYFGITIDKMSERVPKIMRKR